MHMQYMCKYSVYRKYTYTYTVHMHTHYVHAYNKSYNTKYIHKCKFRNIYDIHL